MPRRRSRLNWIYDNELQQFTTPSGQVFTLLQIARLLQDQVECRHDFDGPWVGWRIRQNRLIPPGEIFRASQITPSNLKAFARWLKAMEPSQREIPFPAQYSDQPARKRPPSLRLIKGGRADS